MTYSGQLVGRRTDGTALCGTDVFDGAMITLGMFVLNFMHPGMLLQSTATDSASYMLTERASHPAEN